MGQNKVITEIGFVLGDEPRTPLQKVVVYGLVAAGLYRACAVQYANAYLRKVVGPGTTALLNIQSTIYIIDKT